MKRKKSEVPSRVYEYGCLPPSREGGELIDSQLQRAFRYYNTLIDVERVRRNRQAEISNKQTEVAPKFQIVRELEDQQEAARRAIKLARSKQQPAEVAALAALIKQQKPVLKEARAALKATRSVANTDPSVRAAREQVAAAALAEVSLERARCGLYCFTYMQVEAAVAAAKTSKIPPRRKPDWDGKGQLTVQFQRGGKKAAELFAGTNLQLQIKPLPESAFDGTRAERRMKSRTLIKFRVNSTTKGKPVWVELSIVMHRPMPPDAVVKQARIYRTCAGPARALTRNGRLAPNWKYKLQLVIESQTFVSEPSKAQARIAIDLGWRGHDAEIPRPGIRVAYWKDTIGAHGEVAVPAHLVDKIQHPNVLRGYRDTHFDDIKEAIAKWVQNNDTSAWPNWLRDRASHVHLTRSARKLVSVMTDWAKNRLLGDDSIFQQLTAWRAKEEHLWTWEAHERSKALKARRENYRVFASFIAKKYGVIAIEDLNLLWTTQYAKPENASEGKNRSSRHNRTLAAPAEFIAAIKAAAQKYGALLIEENAKGTSKTCHQCGQMDNWDGRMTVMHTCTHCGATWDRDYNAATNLLNRVNERLDGKAAA